MTAALKWTWVKKANKCDLLYKDVYMSHLISDPEIVQNLNHFFLILDNANYSF